MKVKVTIEGETIKWSKLSLFEPLIPHLCIDFEIPSHNCSPCGVKVSFETSVLTASETSLSQLQFDIVQCKYHKLKLNLVHEHEKKRLLCKRDVVWLLSNK